MKALVMTDVKKLEVQDDYPTSTIQPNEVLIHTAWAGIYGTDKALYNGLPGSADAVPPIVLGHENSGVVAEVGQDVVGSRLATGLASTLTFTVTSASSAGRRGRNSANTLTPLG